MIKKLTAFALLFGVGFALLLWFDSRRGGTPLRTPAGSTGSVTHTEIERAPGAEHQVQLIAGGRLQIDQFDRNQDGSAGRSLTLVAQDSGPAPEGRTALRAVTIEMLDPASGEQVVRVVAERALAVVSQAGERFGDAQIDPNIQLEDVTVSLLRGSRMVPIELTSALLEGDLDLGVFTTPGRAVVHGSGLHAEGNGFRLDEGRGEMLFREDSSCTLSAEGGQPGRLACAGELSIRQPPGEGRRPLFIEATRRALLAVESGDGLSLEAHRISIDGYLDDDGAGFAFESLRASREVELRARGHVFTALSASFALGPSGDLESANLTGSPHGWLDLTGTGDLSAELGEGLELAPGQDLVEVWGEGPMEITWSPEPTFQVAGPARLVWRDTELWAAGGLAGGPSLDGDHTEVRAWTGVDLALLGWNVRTEELEGSLLERGLELETGGYSTISGADEGGIPLDLLARGGFEFRFDGERWIVPLAREVELARGGDRPLGARSERLERFDPEHSSFEAIGQVEVQMNHDMVRGDRLFVEGPDDLVLRSESDALVTLETRAGLVAAREIQRTRETLDAQGAVSANLELGDVLLRLMAESLSISGEIEAALDGEGSGELAGPMLVVARGAVDGDIAAGARTFDVETETLRLWRAPLETEASFRTELTARGEVEARVESPDAEYAISAAELDGLFFDPFERPADVAPEDWESEARGTIEARGDVFVESLLEPLISGRGDRFLVDESRTASLIARPADPTVPDVLPGDVRAEGVLPGSGEPFQMRALRVDFEPGEIAAQRPEILIIGKQGNPGQEAGRLALAELHATSRELLATETRVRFGGQVRFRAKTFDDEEWTLRTELARFDHTGSTLSPTGAFDRLTAEKDVRLSFSQGPEVTGDYLTAEALTGRVRVDGTPARFYGDFMQASTWFEFDTKNFMPSSGPGWMEPAGKQDGSSGNPRDGRSPDH